MLNLIWLGLLLTGVLVAGITGQFPAINQAALNAAKSAVMDVALPLSGAMTLWLGMMRLAEKAGLVQQLARLIRPILVRLFSDVPPDHPALGSIVMNMAANMLGVSNAATPLGLRAMSQLNELNTKPGVATNAMCTLLAINTSSIQLVPATAINILAINGSKNPTGIVGSTLIATFFATLSAIVTVKLLQRLGPFRWENQTGLPATMDAKPVSPPTGDVAAAPAYGAMVSLGSGCAFPFLSRPLFSECVSVLVPWRYASRVFGGYCPFFQRALSPCDSISTDLFSALRRRPENTGIFGIRGGRKGRVLDRSADHSLPCRNARSDRCFSRFRSVDSFAESAESGPELDSVPSGPASHGLDSTADWERFNRRPDGFG